MDGLEVLRELAREFLGARVVAMSGGGLRGGDEPAPLAQGPGAATVLYKPFERAEPLTVVRQSLSPSPA
ncbi:hypothetical protein J8F10_05890 [Gemmata sp. G18]|uniref:Response regulatory domain-containing protein n=1 Tax=Gemmata palustris TaxID=2822762 RepID=A0ABS5BM83_9BACT|nr:hypothetical protein [Gemmata palustris]MBP3954812.1 hypothetical protein [Gemmata palustris]